MNQRTNILLVDDEPRNLDVLEGVLESDEYRLVRAANAQETLLALLNEEFAVIVLDIQMPGMSGIELAHLIKQREKTQHIPIIFLTAFYQDEQRMIEGYNVGAVDYLTKPANPKVLRSKVAVFVDLFRKTTALQKTNDALGLEILQRQKAEYALRETNDALEARVEVRTAALRQARDEAERAGRAKDDFLAALSHELRTPLSPVLLIASEAAGNTAFPDEARILFGTIRKNVELEARLIDDLLDLTRIMRGKLALTLKPRDVHTLLEDAIATVRPDIEQKKLSLKLDLATLRRHVAADDVRLQQVFWNILKNAVKFTPEAGTITVVTRYTAKDDAITVAITDTGIGLSADEISRVFDAFSQGDHAIGGRSHRFGGLGLGLTISRSLVEHHDGTLSISSPGRDQGATFTVELPLLSTTADSGNGSAHTSTGTTPPLISSPRNRRVLLVEDHEPTRKTLEALLRRRHFEVSASGSLAEARALAATRGFDLLISDIGLPDGTGFDLMREMKERYDIRGIALSGYGMEEDIAQSQSAGFLVHLVKPIQIQSLDKALADLQQ
ncbi:hybrid sensor histidine kinase/response regulator [Nibricoccus aquaticus]|uniref:hybrid sensor histidine kinase/response regulator n=1 Tax=Nibricoccus aquaticus TaxID=2576891 RepID=UPI0015861DB5|nr:response regulator [Nibricoccus aquaticus]